MGRDVTVSVTALPQVRRVLRAAAELLVTIDEGDPVLLPDDVMAEAETLRVAFRGLGIRIQGDR